MTAMPAPPPSDSPSDSLATRASTSVLALVSEPPVSTRRSVAAPRIAAEAATKAAASKAALAAGALALPPGPLGWLTIVPEMLAVWRIQAQLVADIAALHGQTAKLGPAQMLYCLFRHTAAQAVRDLAVRVGERVIVRPIATAALSQVATAVGLRLGTVRGRFRKLQDVRLTSRHCRRRFPCRRRWSAGVACHRRPR